MFYRFSQKYLNFWDAFIMHLFHVSVTCPNCKALICKHKLQQHGCLLQPGSFHYKYINIYIYIYSKKRRLIPPGLGSRIWNLGRCLLEPCWGSFGVQGGGCGGLSWRFGSLVGVLSIEPVIDPH